MGRRVVIIGDGAVGTAAAEVIRRRDPLASIEIISDDKNPAYFRAALTNYLMGELTAPQLHAVPLDFYETRDIKRHHARVTHIDTEARTVTALDMQNNIEVRHPYDALIIGTGSRPRRPRFVGHELNGIFALRADKRHAVVMDGATACDACAAWTVDGHVAPDWCSGADSL